MNSKFLKVTAILVLAIYNQVIASNNTNIIAQEMDSITFLEEEVYTEIDFNTTDYLPIDFDAYATPSNFKDISFLEEDIEVSLGFDSKSYLPEGFDPYTFYFDIHSVDYIDEFDNLELNFNNKVLLPAGYTAPVSK
ncbi:MAG: hypothetical protein HKN52_12285 [Eudoraea sp.]|nr:hypothetical protein [Eudoraea sp.]